MRKGVYLKKKPLLLRVAVLLVMANAALLSMTAFAQTTYVIRDGSRVMIHTTSATNPKTVLNEAGLELGIHDSYTTGDGGGTEEIHVQRGYPVSVDYYGQQLEAISTGETVAQLLERLELTVDGEDVISVPLTAETYAGMKLTVGQLVRQNQTYTTALPHETIRCMDAALPEGTQKVLTAGTDGQVLCQAEVTYLNGRETERRLLNRQVITQPVSAVIAVGTATGEEERAETGAAVADRGLLTLPTGEVLTYTEKVTCLATAYTCEGYVGTTATGTRARVGAIAVDPEVFPYGTRFYIQTRDGEYIYGIATAEDCGSKEFIYGTRLDLYFDTRRECIQFGARSCDVYVLG